MDRLPSLRLLTIFDAVHRLGSMQLAASELNVTRPAVSQAIAALEDQLGVPLMDRSQKPAVPTEAGRRLALATRGGLQQIAEAIGEIRLAVAAEVEQVTVSCTLGMATHWLMPRLAGFYAEFPDIRVNVHAPPSDMPVFASGVDVALRFGPRAWRDGPTEKLFDERACPVGSSGTMAALSRPADLVGAALIHVLSDRSLGWAGWAEYFASFALPRPQGPRQAFDNYIQAVQATLDDRGVMLGWRSITEALVDDGTLVELPGGRVDFSSAYWVTSAPEGRRRPASQAFMDWIMEETRSWRAA